LNYRKWTFDCSTAIERCFDEVSAIANITVEQFTTKIFPRLPPHCQLSQFKDAHDFASETIKRKTSSHSTITHTSTFGSKRQKRSEKGIEEELNQLGHTHLQLHYSSHQNRDNSGMQYFIAEYKKQKCFVKVFDQSLESYVFQACKR
jgi:hypothetical protein